MLKWKLQYFDQLMWTTGLIGKDPDAGKDWGQKEKRASENEMAGWLHRYNGHEPGQTSEDGEGQRGLACCHPWDHKESYMTGQLNNSNTCTFNHLPTYPSIHSSIQLSCTVKVYFLLNLHRVRLKHSFCFTCPRPLESPISLQVCNVVLMWVALYLPLPTGVFPLSSYVLAVLPGIEGYFFSPWIWAFTSVPE